MEKQVHTHTIFFKGLNELRAIAALSVVFHHIELYKHRDHIPSLYDYSLFESFIEHLGKNAVYLFFVLSGFLITYLLIAEKEKFKTIDIKNFYIRRILRIWPLYYLIVFVSFFIIPFVPSILSFLQTETHYISRIEALNNNYFDTLLLFICFLPNLALLVRPAVVGAAQSWSVGVEEQFYLVWPFLIRTFRNHVLKLLFAVIIGKFIITLLSLYVEKNLLLKFLNSFKIELMAIGGIAAYFNFYYDIVANYIKRNPFIFYAVVIIISFLLFKSSLGLPYMNNFFFIITLSVFFALLILSIIHTPLSFLNKGIINELGKISYGIYMYHPMLMFLCFGFINTYFKSDMNTPTYNILVYVSILGTTFLVSYLSYRFIEQPLLKLKDKFAKVQSSN